MTSLLKHRSAAPFLQKNTSFRFIFLGILILHILLRLATLLGADPKSLEVPEEYYQGFIGLEILNGLQNTLWNYQIDPYTGGSIATGAIAAVFFSIFGPNLFALKCTGLVFSTATVIAAGLMMKKHFSDAAAFGAMLLLALPAPGPYTLSLLALGSHPESVFFMVLSFGMILDIASGTLKRHSLRPFLFGLSTALGLWFSLLFVSAGICLLIVLASAWSKILYRKETILGIFSGLALGSSPWIAYNTLYPFEGLKFFLAHLSAGPSLSVSGLLTAWARLTALEIPRSFSFFHSFGHYGSGFSYLYTVLISALYLAAVLSLRKTPPKSPSRLARLFLLLFPVLFTLMAAFIRERTSWDALEHPYRYRYFSILYGVLALGAGIGVSQCRPLSVLTILLSLAGISPLLFSSLPGSLLKLPGYSIEDTSRLWPQTPLPKAETLGARPYFSLGRNSFSWNPDTLESFKEPSASQAAGLTLDERRWFYRGAGAALLRDLPNLGRLKDPESSLLINIPQEARADFFYGVGWDIGKRHRTYRPGLFSIYLFPLAEEHRQALREGYEAYRTFLREISQNAADTKI